MPPQKNKLHSYTGTTKNFTYFGGVNTCQRYFEFMVLLTPSIDALEAPKERPLLSPHVVAKTTLLMRKDTTQLESMRQTAVP